MGILPHAPHNLNFLQNQPLFFAGEFVVQVQAEIESERVDARLPRLRKALVLQCHLKNMLSVYHVRYQASNDGEGKNVGKVPEKIVPKKGERKKNKKNAKN